MHVLTFEGWPTLLAGGQERSLFEVICSLRDRGVAVTLAYETQGELLSEYEARGVHTTRIPNRILNWRKWWMFGSVVGFALSLLKLIMRGRRGNRWTLIYLNQYFDVPIAAIYGAIFGVPVVCHLRLAAPPYLSRQFRWGLGRCRLLICNSEFTAKSYADVGVSRESLAVVHNGIDANAFCPPDAGLVGELARRNERLVLYVGRLSPEKGIEVLIRAVGLAKAREPRIRLLIVGAARGDGASPEYVDGLRREARELLGDAVELRGPTADVANLYQRADLTVLPSIWDEPFGRVVIESMACGVPCIATAAGGVLEILGGELKILQFKKGDAEELCDRLLRHVHWRATNPELGVMCRRRVVESFSSPAMMSRIHELLVSAEAGGVGCGLS